MADGELTWQREVSLEGGRSILLCRGRLPLDGVLVHVELVVALQPHAPAIGQLRIAFSAL